MLRTRVVSFSVGFASASAIGLYKLNQDIEKSTQILLKQVENAEKRLKFLEEEFAKMKAWFASEQSTGRNERVLLERSDVFEMRLNVLERYLLRRIVVSLFSLSLSLP